ncbi:uncharacterized protein CTRU02_211864 [Colletotrichum truncatum]|uniref:Uncharacterized protein n=1 Tax=Colletotrichum truncatum TaxID=5467 RepID=A0ACC3YME9_COLTU|nr:uncharacterized protein CTRU02_07273 [Colletotrichum truncatum]KAF6791511.1 hypothetical protein CTRU02_07273 [Colletotrichum truncatum]
MAAMSAAAVATANTITPPSSSHGTGNLNSWDNTENSHDKNSVGKPLSQNGNSGSLYEYGFEPLPPPRKKASNDNLSLSKKRNRRDTDTSAKLGLNNADDVFGGKNGVAEKRSTGDLQNGLVEDSKWIHRDKLARIESEELQAAGIILPRPRASSRPRRGRSEEKLNGSTKRTTSAAADDEMPRPRSRKTSSVSPENRTPLEKMPDLEASAWDLRRPEEIATEGDGNYWMSNGEKKGGSKIPVAKASPAPIPEYYIERNAPSARRQSGGTNELETIAYPKPRPRSGSANTLGATPSLQPAKRSVTDTSPRKPSTTSTTATSRKTSTQAKPTGKPRTRGGKDSTSSITARPTTRSGDLSPGNKKPEGDPPWMVGTYKPDPRLPPEQQLLPTVARRLQQEQWEREGKFGSIYDKEFRPLTAEGLLKPPEAGPSTGSPEEEKQEHDEWPLKGNEAPKSPTSPSIKQNASYSTMPKLSDKPQSSPLPSPRSPRSPMMPTQPPAQAQTITRVPDEPSAANMSMGGEKKKSGGCGCCIVM